MKQARGKKYEEGLHTLGARTTKCKSQCDPLSVPRHCHCEGRKTEFGHRPGQLRTVGRGAARGRGRGVKEEDGSRRKGAFGVGWSRRAAIASLPATAGRAWGAGCGAIVMVCCATAEGQNKRRTLAKRSANNGFAQPRTHLLPGESPIGCWS